MRASVVTCLLLAALAGLGIRWATNQPSAPAYAQEPASFRGAGFVGGAKGNKADPLQPILWEKKIESHLHAQLDDARNDALENAANQLQVFLNDRKIQWRPTADFIRSSKLVKKQEDKVVKLDVADNRPEISPPEMHQIVLQIAVTEADMKTIRQEDHKYRVEQRFWTAGRGLGGLVLLLGALAGYMRLDELTKGYFTLPLRLTALVLGVAGAGAVWFLV